MCAGLFGQPLHRPLVWSPKKDKNGSKETVEERVWRWRVAPGMDTWSDGQDKQAGWQGGKVARACWVLRRLGGKETWLQGGRPCWVARRLSGKESGWQGG